MAQKSRAARIHAAAPVQSAHTSFLDRVRAHPGLVILLALVLLLPFLNKALNIDDPLFIWVAQHIQQHPLDPYGFEANWFGSPAPMIGNVQNPPLSSYWLALAGLVSWHDVWLHLAMLPWALLLVWGVVRLARRIGADPFWAALLTVASAVFLVSATSVMCDVMMVALMVWAVEFWVEGLVSGSILLLLAGGVTAALAGLTKYFALGALPMLVVYTLVWAVWPISGGEARKPGTSRMGTRSWTGVALGTAAGLGLILVWHFWTLHLYGASHITGAAEYATNIGGRDRLTWPRLYPTITFLGGCLMWPLVVACRRFTGALLVGVGLLVGALTLPHALANPELPIHGNMTVLGGVFFAAGVAVLWLTLERAVTRRDRPETWLLVIWIAGTVFFIAVMNWSVGARNVLPLVPALAVLAAMPRTLQPEARAARRKKQLQGEPPADGWSGTFLATGAALGLIVAITAVWADWAWAGSVRRTAAELLAKYKKPGGTVYFQGHWGFQYYMAAGGGVAQDFMDLIGPASGGPAFYHLDATTRAYVREHQELPPDLDFEKMRQTPIPSGDVFIVPTNNTNIEPRLFQNAPFAREQVHKSETVGLWVMNTACGAAFYSNVWGPLPFAADSSCGEDYLILTPGK